mgnify:CR=1 FL=1
MRFIGQYIQSFIARFRNDVYLEDIDTGTIASGGNLGLDSNNKIVKADEATGDITGVALTAGTGVDLTSVSGATGGAYAATIGVDVSDFMSSGAVTNVLTAAGADTMQAEPYFTFRNNSNNSTLALLSNEDTGDLFNIVTTTHGATTLSTVDDDATAAHFKIAADGDILLEPATGDLTMYNAVNDGNPTISLGSSATNRFEIKTAYNIGVGNGISVQEVVDSFEKVNDIKISYKIGPRRAGDVEEIYSDNTKINNELNWFPVMSFESALKTAWIWEKNK